MSEEEAADCSSSSSNLASSRCKILRVGDSSFLIWNSEDVAKIRSHRIVGDFMGTDSKSTHQNDQLVLPMRLMLEEIVLLRSKGLIEVIQYKKDKLLHTDDQSREAYDRWMRSEIDRQSQDHHQTTIAQRLALASKIALGRKKKTSAASIVKESDPNEEDDDEPKWKIPKLEDDRSVVTPEELAAMEEEIRSAPVRRLKETELVKTVWIDSPLFQNDEQYESIDVLEIAPRSELERLRCAVFADLWEKGYYLTSGLKFGGDFLAYPGDPRLYHASHIVVCLPNAHAYDSYDLAASGRLGTQVKKIVLLSTWRSSNRSEKSKISYKSLQWRRYQRLDRSCRLSPKMVLSLVHLALLEIRDGLERGHIKNVHELPRKWHQIILDSILMHGTILRKPCLDGLSSIDFLRQFTFLNLTAGRICDSEYLERSSRSVHEIFSTGDRSIIGDRFLHQLALNIYAKNGSESPSSNAVNSNRGSMMTRSQQSSTEDKSKIRLENFLPMVKLIGKCQNLSTLHLQIQNNELSGPSVDQSINSLRNSIVRFLPLSSSPSSSSVWLPLEAGGFLNKLTAYRSCLSILENLFNLSIENSDSENRRPVMPPLLTSHEPLIQFRRLKSLKLVGGTAYFDAWFKFLQSVSSTLESLHVENVEFHWGRERNASVLPFRMPRLESLQAHGPLSYCDSTFVKNLRKCERLDYVSLTLSGLETDEILDVLKSIPALKDVRLNFRHGLFSEKAAEIVGRMVEMFAWRITSFVFNGMRTPFLAEACEILIDGCEYLNSFRLDTVEGFDDNDMNFQNYLAPLFETPRRAWILRTLELRGKLSTRVLNGLFANCHNLDSLTIGDCPGLSDEYLDSWQGRPASLKLINCSEKVTDRGLRAILKRCGLGLLNFRFTCEDSSAGISNRRGVTADILRILGDYCRNVEWICLDKTTFGGTTGLEKLKKKSFKNPIRIQLV